LAGKWSGFVVCVMGRSVPGTKGDAIFSLLMNCAVVVDIMEEDEGNKGRGSKDGGKRVFKYVKEKPGKERSRADLLLPTKAERNLTFIS
jgi:hypothetical protein